MSGLTGSPRGITPTRLDLLMGILFFPRGGSAFVTRELVRHLPAHGVDVRLLSGSRSDRNGLGDARSFYADCDVCAIDLTTGTGQVPDGPDAGNWTRPMHLTYEHARSRGESWFGDVASEPYEHQVVAWAKCFSTAMGSPADLVYLHHLTPMHAAVAHTWPELPVVTHLHGTELLMMEQLQGEGARSLHSVEWLRRMRRWADTSDAIIIAPGNVTRAASALDLDAARFTELSNGYDPERFFPKIVDRRAVWHRLLVEDPMGCVDGSDPGSLRYSSDDVERLTRSVVMVYVGRFTRVKRLSFMLEALRQTSRLCGREVSLVVVGGYPGEWQDEHPVSTAARLGLDNVYFAGWRDHEDLPDALRASDVLVLPSERESFGQVIVEAMGCGVPVIVGDGFGPSTIVDGASTGWLYRLDSPGDLARVMTVAAIGEAERARRGRRAANEAQRRFSWPGITRDLSEMLRRVADSAQPRRGREETA